MAGKARARRSSPVRIIRAGGRRAGAIARRGLTAAGRAAVSEKHTIAAVIAAAAVGYVDRPGGVELPHVNALGVAGTYGLALWAAGRYTKNPMLQHAATGLLAVAAHDFVKNRPAAAGGDDDPLAGAVDD